MHEPSKEMQVPTQMGAFMALTTDPGIVECMKMVSTIARTQVPTIKDDATERTVTEMLIQSKGILKTVEDRRKEHTDPINRIVKGINGWVKDNITTPIEKKQSEINTALLKYRQEKQRAAIEAQRKADEERRKLQEQADKAGVEVTIPEIVTPQPERIVRTEVGQVQERKQLVVEVVSIKELAGAVVAGAVPEAALTANMEILRNLARAGVQVPGVTWKYETTLTTRGR